MTIQISAVICTLNRANYLRKAIQSLVNQTLDKNLYEILIVDNGSSDDTKRVVVEEFAHVPNLRYLYEPIVGLNQARNTGWRNAKGEYVAYTDDDAIASPQWLHKILDAFRTVQPKPGCVGGKIEPIWEGNRPAWLSDNMAGYLAVLNLSERPITSNERQLLAGVNMACPRHLLEAVGGFHLGLDRKGGNLLSHGDILVQRQAMKSGYPCFYHPEIAVRHHIHASRLSQKWCVRRMYWEGVSEALSQVYLDSLTARKRLQMAFSTVGILLRSKRLLAKLMIPADNPIIFEQQCLTWTKIGYVMGTLGIAG